MVLSMAQSFAIMPLRPIPITIGTIIMIVIAVLDELPIDCRV